MGGWASLAPDKHEPHVGADDNASGTATLMEIARLLAKSPEALRRDVVFVAFSAEEVYGIADLGRSRAHNEDVKWARAAPIWLVGTR